MGWANSMGTLREGLANGRALPLGAVILFAIRFAGPSVAASLGVQGLDTSGLDLFLSGYDAAVPVLAAFLIGILVLTRPRLLRFDPWIIVALLAAIASVVAWAGEVDPTYRLLRGPWAPLPLACSVVAAILLFGIALDRRLGEAGVERMPRGAFRTLYVEFAVAYLAGGLRFVDYATALGSSPPTGLLWLLDYGPTFLLCAGALYFWLVWVVLPSRTVTGWARGLGGPLAGTVGGIAVSQGLGGFVLSNVLAWGGAYEVFSPTAVSLAVVGFAVGSFLAIAWVLGRRLPAREWWLVIGGVCVTGLAGLVFFDGALASLAGILLGLTLVARGLMGRPGPVADGSTPAPR